MDCKQPTISEKLVPFVEGALADADRKEVQEHLPDCEACTAEVRMLRETIQHLRAGTTAGLSYRPGTNLAPEALVEYALFGEEMSPEIRRRTQLTVLESTQLQSELSLLHDLERALGEKPEPEKVAIGMPQALRAAIAKTYGTGPVLAVPAWKLQLIAWRRSWSHVRFGRLGLMLGMVLIVCLGLAAGPTLFRKLRPAQELAIEPVPSPARLPPGGHPVPAGTPTRGPALARVAPGHSALNPTPQIAADFSPNTTAPVSRAVTAPAASKPAGLSQAPIRAAGQSGEAYPRRPSPSARALAPVSAPAGRVAQKSTGSEQVPLFSHKVNAEDLPRYSRQLWGAQIAHSYRDGQLFVASNDASKAWSVLHQTDQQAVANKREATRAVASAPVPVRPLVQAPGRARVPFSARPGRLGRAPSRARYVPPPAREIAAALAGSSSGPDFRVAPRSSRAAANVHRVSSRPRRKPSHLALFSSVHRASREKNLKTSIQVKDYAGAKVSKRAAVTDRHSRVVNKPQLVVRSRPSKPKPTLKKATRVEVAMVQSDAGTTSSALQARIARPKASLVRVRKSGQKIRRDEAPPLPTEVNTDELADAAGSAQTSMAAGVAAPAPASRAEPVSGPLPSSQVKATAVGNVSDTTYLNNGQTLDVVVPLETGTPEGQKLRLGRKVALRFFSRGQIEVQVRADDSFLITLKPVRRLNSDEVDHLRTELRRVLQLSASDSLVIRQP